MTVLTMPSGDVAQGRAPTGSGAGEAGMDTFARLRRVLAERLHVGGKWQSWQREDERLSGVAGFEEAATRWRDSRTDRGYLVVAALASLGSRRGGDDDDAALAVVVLLEPGIHRLALDLRDFCEVDDVCTAVWEEVKAAGHLGPRAPSYLLRRAGQRLQRPAAGLKPRHHGTESLDQLLGWQSATTAPSVLDDWLYRRPQLASPDPAEELSELLTWARSRQVVTEADADLLLQLTAAADAGLRRQQAQQQVGQRYGLTMRSVRRRRDLALARLRAAAPAYLAATS